MCACALWVCLYECQIPCMCVYACMCVCLHICLLPARQPVIHPVRQYVHMDVYICMYVYLSVCMYGCMYVCMNVCMYSLPACLSGCGCMSVCMYVCMPVCLSVGMPVCLCLHCLTVCMRPMPAGRNHARMAEGILRAMPTAPTPTRWLPTAKPTRRGAHGQGPGQKASRHAHMHQQEEPALGQRGSPRAGEAHSPQLRWRPNPRKWHPNPNACDPGALRPMTWLPTDVDHHHTHEGQGLGRVLLFKNSHAGK